MSANGSSRLTIAYLCDRLGPYHRAQLSAANRDANIVAIEFSAIDQTYDWVSVDNAGSPQKVTLFTDRPITMYSGRTVTKRLRNVLDKIRPQIVAIPGWDAPASLSALWWCMDSGTPAIMMSDSQECDEARVWWKEYIKGRVVRMASAGFVGGTPHIDYLMNLGMVKDRIVVGGDVVDNEYYAEKTRIVHQNATSVRRQYSLPERFFLVSCRFIQKKNLPTVLRAYAQYRQAVGDRAWKLVLLGDGPLKQRLVKLRDELGLAEMVLMPGFKQYAELPAYYGLAGAFVLASLSEQWGLVVNEAMASGLPVIVSSRCGCAPDLVKHGENGFVFDPHDVGALARHLKFVSSDDCPRDIMGNASRRIIKDWDLEKFACNLSAAAELAMKAPQRRFGFGDRALLWALIHRLRS